MKTKRTTNSITETMTNIVPTIADPGTPLYGVPHAFDQPVKPLIIINSPIIPKITANTTILIFPYLTK